MKIPKLLLILAIIPVFVITCVISILTRTNPLTILASIPGFLYKTSELGWGWWEKK